MTYTPYCVTTYWHYDILRLKVEEHDELLRHSVTHKHIPDDLTHDRQCAREDAINHEQGLPQQMH